ncbi:MAG: tetratricopeptide repeat protein [Patescibacteria group bacterium]
MILLVLIIIVIVFCLAYLGYIFFKHLPDLKSLDISSISGEKQGEVRTKILHAKFLRSSAKAREKIRNASKRQKDFFAGKIKEIKEKVSKLEKRYQGEATEEKEPVEILKEADDLIKEDDFSTAEKKLIEVIAKDKKNVEAYESLGELYFKNKNYDQAEEVFKYLIKLRTVKSDDAAHLKNGRLEEAETDFLSSFEVDPKVVAYYDDLGQIYEVTGKPDKALDAYLKASSVEPNNPKYLDKLTELGVRAGDKGLARRSFNRLKQINPKNGKLAEFKEAIEKMK